MFYSPCSHQSNSSDKNIERCPVADCGVFLKVEKADDHILNCHLKNGGQLQFAVQEDGLKRLRRLLSRSIGTRETQQIERVKLILQEKCLHKGFHVLEAFSQGPNLLIRTCAACGLDETAQTDNIFEVLKFAIQRVPWAEFSKVQSFELLKLKRIDPDLV